MKGWRERAADIFTKHGEIAAKMKSALGPGTTIFWRVKGSGTNEIDYLEESAEKGLVAYEFKWNPAKAAKSKCPKVFAEAYPDARWQCISRENYVEFVTGMI